MRPSWSKTSGRRSVQRWCRRAPRRPPQSPSRAEDRRQLAAKLARADFAITQFFFERDHYFRLVDEVAAFGVTKPILPGIMPVTNKGQVVRMAELSSAAFPTWLAERLDTVEEPEDVRRVGVEVATELCRELLDAGAPGLHFYTLNRSTRPGDLRQPGTSRRCRLTECRQRSHTGP